MVPSSSIIINSLTQKENLRNNLLLEISNSSNVRVGELEQKINSLNEEKVCFEEKYEKLKARY